MRKKVFCDIGDCESLHKKIILKKAYRFFLAKTHTALRAEHV